MRFCSLAKMEFVMLFQTMFKCTNLSLRTLKYLLETSFFIGKGYLK